MSEDFDKEAEREKLREQFAEEEEDRKATQQMSELLLRGATMTNQHCPTCGDPIFRHNGQEFCPSCQGPGGQAAQGGQDPAQGQAGGGQQAAQDHHPGQSRATDSPAAQSPDQGRAQDAPAEQGTAATDDAAAADGPAARQNDDPDAIEVQTPGEAARTPDDARTHAGEAATPSDAPAQRQADPADRRPGQGATAGAAGSAPAAGDLGDARANVELALERFAAMAAETDDPRRAKECLAAAREAAATLAELRR